MAQDDVPLPSGLTHGSPLEAEATLLARLRDGDSEAGHRFVRDYYPLVFRYLLSLTGHREAAEDLTQETFLQAWRHLDQFQGRAPLRVWLHAIARREFLRARRRHRAVTSLEEAAEPLETRSDAWASEAELRLLLAKLPGEQQEVMLLYYLASYRSSEIAQITQAPERTVRYRLAAARAHLAQALGQGDITFLNEPTVPMRQWAWLPLDQIYALETHLAQGGADRRTPDAEERTAPAPGAQQEEAMERREFLHTVAAGAVGMMLPESEKEIVDRRLAQKATFAFKGTALAELCEHLRSETGVHLAAGPSVGDEKVTLFCEKLPLREVMRQLSRPFGYTWLRSGNAGEYRYELVQDLRSQLLEEELRNRDRNEALLALDREVSRLRPYLDLSPAEAEARAKTAGPAEKELLERLAGKGWGPVQMYFRLPPQELAALRAGQEVTFSAEPRPGQLPLPPDVARGVLQSWRDWRVLKRGDQFEFDPAENLPEGLPPSEVPEVRAKVTLRLTQSEPGEFTLGESASGFTIGNHNSMISGLPLASGRSAASQPRNTVADARLARDPALRAPVTVRPAARCGGHASGPSGGSPRVSDGQAAVRDPKTTSAEVLEALHRVTGLPLVADYYTRLYPLDEVSVQNQPLTDALNLLCDRMRMRWQKDAGARETAGWLQFRSASFYDDRLKEVPNRLLERWSAARQRHGRLALDDLVEIAQLPDAQLDGDDTAEGARECWGLDEWDLARTRHLRPHLCFLATLSPEQRQEAASPAGVEFAKLALAQQQQFISLGIGGAASAIRSLEELTTATMHVDYTLPGWFQWHAAEELLGAGWPPLRPARVRERTREAALQAALRLDLHATEAQITATQPDVTFIYSWGPPGNREVRWVRKHGHWGTAVTRR